MSGRAVTAFAVPSRRVEKPWGRRDLPSAFADPGDLEPIGEIIFDPPTGLESELLVKFLFTSEKLSIQVHPDDQTARAQGKRRGKDEAWIVLSAEADSTIGLGLTRSLSKEQLRAAALDGSLETLVDWRRTVAGDCHYSPAGTIHAIGPGLSLVEVQQNLDVTYRLYDYGRPRELHLDQAIDAARAEPAQEARPPMEIGPGRTGLAQGPAFQVEQLAGAQSGQLNPPGRELWLIALEGGGQVAERDFGAGEVWYLDEGHQLKLDPGSRIVIAYPGQYRAQVWRPD